MKLLLFNDHTCLPTVAPDLRMRQYVELEGCGVKAGTVIISPGGGRAPIRTDIADGAAWLPAMTIEPGEHLALCVEAQAGRRTVRWSAPELCADKRGVLTLPDDVCYTQLLELKTALDRLSGQLRELDKRFSTREKNSKNPSIGGTKI